MKKVPGILLFAFTAVFLVFAPNEAKSADIFSNSFSSVTRFGMDSGLFKARSSISFDITMRGGDRLSAFASLDVALASPETNAGWPSIAVSPVLKSIGLSAKDLFSKDIEATWFIGGMDRFGDGKIFVSRFGKLPFASEFLSPASAVPATAKNYDALYEIAGTGARFMFGQSNQRRSTLLYAYQDAYSGAGYYGADIRYVYSSDSFDLDAFAGGSFAPIAPNGVYRIGTMLHLSGQTTELLIMAGIPRWDSSTAFDTSLFQALIEPRLHLGVFNAAFSFLYKPAWQGGAPTGEAGKADFGLRLSFGKLYTDMSEAGVDIRYAAPSMTALLTPSALYVAPFWTSLSRGARWDFRFLVKILPVSASFADMLLPSIGFSASL